MCQYIRGLEGSVGDCDRGRANIRSGGMEEDAAMSVDVLWACLYAIRCATGPATRNAVRECKRSSDIVCFVSSSSATFPPCTQISRIQFNVSKAGDITTDNTGSCP